MSDKDFTKDYTIDEVAVIIGVHRNTVKNLIDAGELEAYTVGTRYRITPLALERLRRKRRVKPVAEDDLVEVGA